MYVRVCMCVHVCVCVYAFSGCLTSSLRGVGKVS